MVTSTSGSAGTAGSLPWAVQQANNNPGLDFIHFNLSGGGIHVITIADTLYLNDHVVVDGKTQPGYSGTPLVYVHGGAGVPSIFLLQLNSDGSTIQGLGIFKYTSNAVTIFSTSNGNWIQDNWMGFYQGQLNSSLFPFTRGIGIQSSFNVIRKNTISGVDNAITMGEDIAGSWSGAVYKSNSIRNNRIGSSPSGQSCTGYGNTSDGVVLGAGARENFIGPNNIIGCNASAGVELIHSTNAGNVIFGNAIGNNWSAVLPNGELGVLLTNGAQGNAIGGPFGGNVISGNGLGGVALGTDCRPVCAFTHATGNWVQYNVIGLDHTQNVVLGPQEVGVAVIEGSSHNTIEGNLLAGHTEHGVILADAASNSINENWIGMNRSGVHKTNGAFGIVFVRASHNFAVGNAYGSNALGDVVQAQGSCCNVIH